MAFDIAQIADEIFDRYPSRFKSNEKEELFARLRHILLESGYSEAEVKITVHDGMITSRNMIIGNPSTAKYFITAHYDTPGTNGFLLGTAPLVGQTGANIAMLLIILPLFILEILIGNFTLKASIAAPFDFFLPQLPLLLYVLLMFIPMFIKNRNNRNDNTSGVLSVLDCALRAANDPALKNKCCFILFDNEEWGLVGSSQFAAWCRKSGIPIAKKTVLNLDCVGVGDTLVAASTGKKTGGVRAVLDAMNSAGAEIVEQRSMMVYMSDHANFRDSVMFSYMSRSKLGPLYIPNIHSPKDVECDIALVDDLSARILNAISNI